MGDGETGRTACELEAAPGEIDRFALTDVAKAHELMSSGRRSKGAVRFDEELKSEVRSRVVAAPRLPNRVRGRRTNRSKGRVIHAKLAALGLLECAYVTVNCIVLTSIGGSDSILAFAST
jgi:hypothetical protein